MKHIKKFNESNTNDIGNFMTSVLSDIKDIFLEDIDLGYQVRLSNPNSKYSIDDNLVVGRKQIGDVDVYISKVKETNHKFFITLPFTPNDINESLDRVIHYMENLNYDYEMYGEWYKDGAEKLNSDSDIEIKNLHIRFRKTV